MRLPCSLAQALYADTHLCPYRMPRVQLVGVAIKNWDTFHDQCAAAFGFPEFYGRNMNAWIDCLTYVRDGDGMSAFALGPTATLDIEISDAEAFNRQAPEVMDALIDCTAAVNRRHIDVGELPALHLIFV